MQPPPRYKSQGEFIKHLRKSLYRLKQAGRKWYDTLYHALADLGFSINNADPGMFYAHINNHILILAIHVNDCLMTGSSISLITDYKKRLNAKYSLTDLGFSVNNADLGMFYAHINNHILILAIHVDDCLMTGSSINLITDYKKRLNAKYLLTDLGKIHWLLGIKIMHDREARTISLMQTTYIETILDRFSLSDAKPYVMPIVPGAIYSKSDAPADATEVAYMAKVPYCEAVGSLMYAAVATRPNITFTISTLSQFLENPGHVHWEAVKQIFRYLTSTKTHVLTYGNERHDLIGFTNADGTSQEHRHAISGFTFLIDSGAVSWASHKQELITLSTAEAKYVAAMHAAKECIWLHRLTEPLFGTTSTPTTLYCNNQAMLHLVEDDNYHTCTKHIDIRYHFIRQTITQKQIAMEYCPTEEMTADILMKALPKYKAAIHIQNLGIHHT